MKSRIRGLRARLGALLAVAAAVGVAAGFAALTATAWTVALPLGARADVAASPADSIVVSKTVPSNVGVAQLDSFLRKAVAADAPGVFTVSRVVNSSPYRLSGSTGQAIQQIYAVDTPPVRAHAVLSAGVWPSTATDARTAASTGSPAACTTQLDISDSLRDSLPPCAVVPAALPAATADQLKLRVGDRLTISYSPNYPPVSLVLRLVHVPGQQKRRTHQRIAPRRHILLEASRISHVSFLFSVVCPDMGETP